MRRWLAAFVAILIATAAIPIVLNSNGPRPVDRQPGRPGVQPDEDRSGSAYCGELKQIARIWKLEMNRQKGSRSGSTMNVMDLADSESKAMVEHFRAVHEYLVARRDACRQLTERDLPSPTAAEDRTDLAAPRDRLVASLNRSVEALNAALKGVEEMAIPRADRAETVRLWNQVLTVDRAMAAVFESLSRWTIDRLLATEQRPMAGNRLSLQPLASILQDREFSEKLSRALFRANSDSFEDLKNQLDEITMVLEQSAEAIYVRVGMSKRNAAGSLASLLRTLRRLQSRASMLEQTFRDHLRSNTRNFQDVGIALADFLLSKALVEQQFDSRSPAPATAIGEISVVDVKSILAQIGSVEKNLDRLAGLRSKLEAICTRTRCRFKNSVSFQPPRHSLPMLLGRASQTAEWLERLATEYTIYDASLVGER